MGNKNNPKQKALGVVTFVEMISITSLLCHLRHQTIPAFLYLENESLYMCVSLSVSVYVHIYVPS